MAEIRTRRYCRRCGRDTAQRFMGMRDDAVTVECLGCLTVSTRKLSARVGAYPRPRTRFT